MATCIHEKIAELKLAADKRLLACFPDRQPWHSRDFLLDFAAQFSFDVAKESLEKYTGQKIDLSAPLSKQEGR